MKAKSLIKWMLVLFITFMAGALFTFCRKNEILFPDPSTIQKGLPGSWVEITTLEDTISFNSNKDTGFFVLSRGYAMTNGYWLPKIGSAPYEYIISGGTIYVRDGLSSSMEGGTYYFNFDKQDLVINIGKFSKYISTSKPVLTFRKIK